MKVGMTTATATIQGLIARRPAAAGVSAALLTMRPLSRTRNRSGSWSGSRGACGEGGERLQDLPGVRPRGRLLVVDVRGDRKPDEQGVAVGVVVGQLDADGQALDDLHKVAGGVLRRQQGQGLAGA